MHGGRPGRPIRVVRPVRVVQSLHPVHRVEPTAFYVYGAQHSDRVVYSPYALEYGSSGLIPGDMRYSPYALEYGKSGLVPSTAQYSPYAFDNKNSGLISDLPYGYRPSGYWGGVPAPIEPGRSYAVAGYGYGAMGGSSAVPQKQIRGYRASWPVPSTDVQSKWPEPDQKKVIRDYLTRTRPGEFEVTRLVSMDNETVSFDVVLKDRNLVVKYWNGTKIHSIKRQGGFRHKAWTNYLVDWMEYRDQFEATGGKVYHIASEDTYELLRQLGSCLQTDNR